MMRRSAPGREGNSSGRARRSWKRSFRLAGRICLIRNGRLVKEEHRRAALQWDVDVPGVYRIEAQQYVAGRWRPWIYSNPIWVR